MASLFPHHFIKVLIYYFKILGTSFRISFKFVTRLSKALKPIEMLPVTQVLIIKKLGPLPWLQLYPVKPGVGQSAKGIDKHENWQ